MTNSISPIYQTACLWTAAGNPACRLHIENPESPYAGVIPRTVLINEPPCYSMLTSYVTYVENKMTKAIKVNMFSSVLPNFPVPNLNK